MSSFGIRTLLQQTTYPALLTVWREADLIDHAWLDDHFVPIYSDIVGPCTKDGRCTLPPLGKPGDSGSGCW